MIKGQIKFIIVVILITFFLKNIMGDDVMLGLITLVSSNFLLFQAVCFLYFCFVSDF